MGCSLTHYIRFSRKSDVRFVFTPFCVVVCLCFIYVICIYLHKLVSQAISVSHDVHFLQRNCSIRHSLQQYLVQLSQRRRFKHDNIMAHRWADDGCIFNDTQSRELKKTINVPLKLQHYTVHYYNYQTRYFYNRYHTNHSHNLDLSSIYSIHSFYQHFLDSDICKLLRLK